jgi:hypothetical protein
MSFNRERRGAFVPNILISLKVPGENVGLLPGHVYNKLLSSHSNLFEDLLSSILGDMVFGHHSIRLNKSAKIQKRIE